ncbi:MAG: hypothetical protein HC933_21330 [Pleurocapsa sp. SU_196_0]|nr:hypothetical protein [Pleurocapsa sp. SU_196_0]
MIVLVVTISSLTAFAQAPALRLTAAQGVMTVYHGRSDARYDVVFLSATENGKPAPEWVRTAFLRQQGQLDPYRNLTQTDFFTSTAIVTEQRDDGARVVRTETTSRSTNLFAGFNPMTFTSQAAYLPDGRIEALEYRVNSLLPTFALEGEAREVFEESYERSWQLSVLLLEACYIARVGEAQSQPIIADPKRFEPNTTEKSLRIGSVRVSQLRDGRFECRVNLETLFDRTDQPPQTYEITTRFLPDGREDTVQSRSAIVLQDGAREFQHQGRVFSVKSQYVYRNTYTLERDPNSP